MLGKTALVLMALPFLIAPIHAAAAQEAVGASSVIAQGERATLRSAILNEDRIVFVSTPPSYRDGQRYPVLYLTDAQWNFDHARSSVGLLARNRMIPEMIVVGVVNQGRNVDRTRDLYSTQADFQRNGVTIPFPNSGNGDRFLEFLQQELIPWVETNYRTTPLRVLAGQSAGGNFALHAMRTKPLLFQAIIAASPWLAWDDHREMRELERFLTSGETPVRALFFSYADEGSVMQADIAALTAALRARNDPNLRWASSTYPEETHDSTVIKSYYDGLRMIFAGWAPPRDPATNALIGSLEDLRAHYENLSEQFGVAFAPPANLVSELGYQYLARREFNEALAVFRVNTQDYPQSANAWDSLGEGLERAGHVDEALASYRRAVALAEANHDERLETFRTHAARLANRR